MDGKEVRFLNKISKYLNIREWPQVFRCLELPETEVKNVQEQYRHYDFSEQVYQMLLKWKQICPNANVFALIPALEQEGFCDAALKIKNHIVTWDVTLPTYSEQGTTSYVKIKVGNSSVVHVTFSHDEKMFAACEKKKSLQIWEWAASSSCGKIFETKMEEPIYASFNDNDEMLLACDGKAISIYKIEDGLKIVSRIPNNNSITYGSWLEKDTFLSGKGVNGGIKGIFLNRITEEVKFHSGNVRSECGIWEGNENIEKAELLKTFRDKSVLACKFDTKLGLKTLGDEDINFDTQGKSERKFEIDKIDVGGNIGFFKLAPDNRNLFVLLHTSGKAFHHFKKIDLGTSGNEMIDFQVDIEGHLEYSDFAVNSDNIFLGVNPGRTDESKGRCCFVYSIQKQRCIQKLKHGSKVCSVALCPPKYDRVVVSDRGGNVIVWSFEDLFEG